jgi:NADPH:quinone reductase-like Zn-dependent oxidoreductase
MIICPRDLTLTPQQDLGDLKLIKSLLEAGKIVPVIDIAYPLEKTPDAFRQYEREHSRGEIVIHID